jgi:hypothetical protein
VEPASRATTDPSRTLAKDAPVTLQSRMCTPSTARYTGMMTGSARSVYTRRPIVSVLSRLRHSSTDSGTSEAMHDSTVVINRLSRSSHGAWRV